MSIDPQRYGLITNEFRWREAYNPALEVDYIKARELEVGTHFDLATIGVVLNDLFGVVGEFRRRFQLDIVGTDYISPDDFVPKTPARYLTAPEFGLSMHPVIVTRCAISEEENLTVLEVWG